MTGSTQSTQERDFRYAESPIPLENPAGSIMFRPVEGSIRVITNPVAYSQIESYRSL
jgi:hypothetical protein